MLKRLRPIRYRRFRMTSVERVGDLQLVGFSHWYRGKLRIMACKASLDETSEADWADVDVLLLLICSELLSAVSDSIRLASKTSTVGVTSVSAISGGDKVSEVIAVSAGIAGSGTSCLSSTRGGRSSPSSSSLGGGAGKSPSGISSSSCSREEELDPVEMVVVVLVEVVPLHH